MCKRFGVAPFHTPSNLKVGIALNVKDGMFPINGLRHSPEAGTSGWYIWAGVDSSDSDDFFQPLHLDHLSEWCPDVLRYLALPPGWRFLVAPDYEDVWYDESLKTVNAGKESPEEVRALLGAYEDLAIAWDGDRQAKKANLILDRLHVIALQLRPLENGRRGLEALLLHETRGVRLMAAGDCLAWGSEAAISALEKWVSPRGTHSLSAETTLREYRAGRMRFDW